MLLMLPLTSLFVKEQRKNLFILIYWSIIQNTSIQNNSTVRPIKQSRVANVSGIKWALHSETNIWMTLFGGTGTYRGHGGHSRREAYVGHWAACVSSPAQVGFKGAVAVCLMTRIQVFWFEVKWLNHGWLCRGSDRWDVSIKFTTMLIQLKGITSSSWRRGTDTLVFICLEVDGVKPDVWKDAGGGKPHPFKHSTSFHSSHFVNRAATVVHTLINRLSRLIFTPFFP